MSDLIRINGWIRKLTSSGIVYYVKRKTGETRWEHPGLSLVLDSLCSFDNIRYAAYRLSTKLLKLSECLETISISLNVLVKVTSHHGVLAPTLILDSQYIRDILHDIYNGCSPRLSTLKGATTVYAEAMANFIEQILDPAHQGGVTSLGLKTVMAVFCRARLRDKLTYIFREHAHKGVLGVTELTYMLSILSRIPEMLGEGIMFGSGVVSTAVQSALKVGGGRGVTQEAWLYWAGRDPPELVWMTTSYRLLSGAGVQHNIDCTACCQHIIGLRYQCLQCLGYDLCQSCFFTGAATRGHRPKHPVQEYCFPSTRGDQMKAVLATLVNKIKPKAILKQRKKLTRKLTVDKHEGQRIVDQYRESRGHRTDGTYGTLPAHSTLPARGTLTAPSSYPVHSAQTGTLQMGTLSRQDQGRRPMRKGSRSSSKDEDLYASPLDLVGPQGPQHELARQHGIPGDLSPVYDRISPSSSGFCSGSDSHSSEIRPNEKTSSKSPRKEKPPRRNRERSFRKAREPPALARLKDDSAKTTLKDDLVKSRESVAELEWDDAGIQLNDDLGPDQFWRNQGHDFDHSILRRDIDTGEMMVYKEDREQISWPSLHNISTIQEELELKQTPTKQEIVSIIGHLETDEKRLSDKLRDSPSLAQPISEAQEQLARLKDMMLNIFGPKPPETEVDHQLNLTDRESNLTDRDANYTGSQTLDMTKCQVESTRLDGVNHYTPLHIKQTNYVFSPIVFDTENIENNTPENKTEEGTFAEEEGSETFDISFTRYQLSDLTERLGGTGLSYSKNSLLDVTDKLRDDSPSPILAESYSEAVDELEHLMHSLSNLFENFAPKQNGDKKQNGGNDGPAFSVGEPGKVLKIVAELNKLMMDTKETKI